MALPLLPLALEPLPQLPHPFLSASAEQEVCCRGRGGGCQGNWCLLTVSPPPPPLLPLALSPLNFSPRAVSLLHTASRFLCAAIQSSLQQHHPLLSEPLDHIHLSPKYVGEKWQWKRLETYNRLASLVVFSCLADTQWAVDTAHIHFNKKQPVEWWDDHMLILHLSPASFLNSHCLFTEKKEG